MQRPSADPQMRIGPGAGKIMGHVWLMKIAAMAINVSRAFVPRRHSVQSELCLSSFLYAR